MNNALIDGIEGPSIDSNPLQSQAARLKLKRALLAEQARRNMEAAGVTPQGQMVSGHYVAPSLGEHLAALATKGVNRYNVGAGEKEAAAEEGSLKAQIEKAAAAAMAQGRDTEQPFQAPGFDEADAAAASQGARTVVKGDRAAAGRALSQIPGYETIGTQMLSDELINAPVRAEARAARREDREDRQAQAAAELAAKMKQRQEEIAAKLEQQGLDRASREALQRESMELRRDLATLMAATQRDVAGIAAGGRADAARIAAGNRPVPNAIVQQLGDAEDKAQTLGRLKDTFKPEFSGLKGAVSAAAGSYLPGGTEAADWWKDYNRNSALIERHQLFGASFTKPEADAWKAATISPTMDDKTIARNLAKQAEIATGAYNRNRTRYEKSGYNVSDAFPERATGAAAAGGPVKVTSKAERDALPPGTRYIGPDGNVATR